jgi:hypothetical protein
LLAHMQLHVHEAQRAQGAGRGSCGASSSKQGFGPAKRELAALRQQLNFGSAVRNQNVDIAAGS